MIFGDLREPKVAVVDLGFTTLLTTQVISVAFYSEREKSGKFCSEALISAWGSFKCRKSTTRDLRLYFSFEGFLWIFKIWKNPSTRELRVGLKQGSSTFWVRGPIYIFHIILRAAVIAGYKIIMDILNIIIRAWAEKLTLFYVFWGLNV